VYTVLIDKGYMSAVIAGGAAAAYEVFDPCLRLPLAHGVNALYPSDDGTAGLPKWVSEWFNYMLIICVHSDYNTIVAQ
jgi:hypothetical protein